MLFPNPEAAARQYRKIATQSTVDDASPHRLIQLMMQRALEKIGLAKSHIRERKVQEKGNNISDAISIINGLQASLNHSADARLSENFDALYAYMMRRLLEANLHNNTGMLDEVAGLLREIKEAWDAIADEVEGA
ncbi:MAG: flagellar export chaperone FliS [Woeseiaceae bacterium]|nr:flagellar export chaperone FliS [Woeseiaceae bacterium]